MVSLTSGKKQKEDTLTDKEQMSGCQRGGDMGGGSRSGLRAIKPLLIKQRSPRDVLPSARNTVNNTVKTVYGAQLVPSLIAVAIS